MAKIFEKKMIKRYKFLRSGYKSEAGNHKWKVGKWYECDQELEMCKTGFHCSKGIYQAFSHVQGEILAQVEVKGKSIKEEYKEVWEKMRVVKAWEWTKKDSVLFAIYAARLVLKYFEKECPNDDRPRKAIEAAERWIKNPTEKNKRTAEAAFWAARSATGYTAWADKAAEAAVWAVKAAAGYTAWATGAAGAAFWATRAAAKTVGNVAGAAFWDAEIAMYKKLDRWMKKHLVNLKVLKDVSFKSNTHKL